VTATTSPNRARRRSLIAVGFCVAAIAAIVVLAIALSENVVYFRTVTEAVAHREGDGTNQVRMAGKVVKDTLSESADGVRFEITDGKTTATVVHRGDPPELFKEGRPVVCEGHWGNRDQFDSERILIRHGNNYKPPKVDDGPTKTNAS
jgi:cytochrome c-type biogenesis protein CcmE